MFTGIVSETGRLERTEERDDHGRAIWVRADLLADAQLGASVAVDGVCLTVAGGDGPLRRFDVSPETLARSTLGAKPTGSDVNLERPLRAGDELGGHIVQGHVDGVGAIERINGGDDGVRVRIAAATDVLRYVVEKGSITVDGVSLTITTVDGSGFEVALIPHTLEVTTLGRAEPGNAVNLEVDVLAKYVERSVAPYRVGALPRQDDGYL